MTGPRVPICLFRYVKLRSSYNLESSYRLATAILTRLCICQTLYSPLYISSGPDCNACMSYGLHIVRYSSIITCSTYSPNKLLQCLVKYISRLVSIYISEWFSKMSCASSNYFNHTTKINKRITTYLCKVENVIFETTLIYISFINIIPCSIYPTFYLGLVSPYYTEPTVSATFSNSMSVIILFTVNPFCS